MPLKHIELKAQQRNERENYHINLGLRVHRALSWLDRSEQSSDDQDAEFIFLWIAFNAAYSNEIDLDHKFSEQETFHHFFELLCQLDKEQKIYNLLWNEFAGTIRVLLNNKFVFQPFWDYQNKTIENEVWQDKFKKSKISANNALGDKNTTIILSIVFSRLYTLRNQLLHGGATWNSQVNREQMRDAVNFLSKLVPVIIKIMMDNHKILWGEPRYPVIED